jgi:hypothetical protein
MRWVLKLCGIISGLLTILSLPTVPDSVAAWGPVIAWVDESPTRWLLPVLGWVGVAAVVFALRLGRWRGERREV